MGDCRPPTCQDVPLGILLARHNRRINVGGGRSMVSQRFQHLVGWSSHIGRTHQVNQDAGGAWTWVRPGGEAASLALVADGVSAGLRSEDASKLAVESFHHRLAPLLAGMAGLDEIERAIHETMLETNRTIAARPHGSLSQADATTLALAVVVGKSALAVWVGDSRIYVAHGDDLNAMSRDHSWVEEVVQTGLMPLDQAERDPRSRMITRWLGPGRDDPGADSVAFPVQRGTEIVCCSDGLYLSFAGHPAGVGDMARILRDQPDDPQGAADVLVALALQRGGNDDITAAVISVR